MNTSPACKRLRLTALARVALLFLVPVAGAQQIELRVTDSPDPVIAGSTLVYTINADNFTGISLGNIIVSNEFPASVDLIDVVPSPPGVVVSSNNNLVVVDMGSVLNGASGLVTVTTRPRLPGSITNVVSAYTPTLFGITTSNVVTQVTAPPADVGVFITSPPANVLVGDSTTFTVGVTNHGLDAAFNLVLTNTVPLDLEILEILPSTPTPTFTNDLVLLSLGMLDGGESATFDFTIQPTNSGNFTLSTTYGAIGLVDTNSANNVASTNFDVVDILSTNLLATNLTSQAFNPQTGLMEQTIRLSNAGTNSVPAARVIVTGLTNTLFNAVGTNYGDPFVLHAAQLDPGQSVELLLEYFNPTRLPTVVSNSAYIAVGVPAVDLTPASTNALAITNIVCLPSGAALIEFPSTPNASYTILYSEEAAFTNVLSAVPAIIAPADRVQWIDSGPPKTISHPTNVTMRFYRVLSLP